MINWHATTAKFGHKTKTDLAGHKRPKVVCQCDGCGKDRDITIRVKSKIIDNQLKWLCPSCVCLGRSSQISTSTTTLWQDPDYRDNQITIKNELDYRVTQAEMSRRRWLNDEYRSQLETGINTTRYLEECERRFHNQFDYDLSSFTNWKNKISIVCKTCGFQFLRMPLVHMTYGSCSFCRLPADLKTLIPASEPVIINDRTAISPLELDIYWPQQRFAIEYHGLYWHSYNQLESSADKIRHQTKALACLEQNIRLLQIFDYEWLTKKELIISMVGHMLGHSQQLMARNLIVKTITNNIVAPFFSINHLQGHRPANTTLALYYNNDIFMAMSFSKHKDGYEIIRMATKMGYYVCGGASRLLHHFKRLINNKPIYTFADLRHSTGNVYKQLGFKVLNITHPGYYYYKNNHNNILSRQRCQKHRLQQLLNAGFDNSLSESQNMFNNGYRRYWDAGHLKLMLTKG
jgi:hypothetical protein